MQSRTSILAQKVRCKKFKQPVRGCYFYYCHWTQE